MAKSLFDGMLTYVGADCPYCANPDEDALPVTRGVLDRMKCADPECTVEAGHHIMGMAPDCHPAAHLQAFYCQQHGTLAHFCGECGNLQGVFQIANRKALWRSPEEKP